MVSATRKELGRSGFEPLKAMPADLQSAPFGHFGTYPFSFALKAMGMKGCNLLNFPSTRK